MTRTTRLALAGLSLGAAAALTVFATVLPSVARASSGTTVSRTYPWSSDSMVVDVPADVDYRPAPAWHLTITAPERTLRQLVVENGRIRAKPHTCFSLIPFCVSFGTDVQDTVHVEVSGPALHAISVDGAARIRLHQLHQDRLALKIDGSGKVRGTGTVQDLSVAIDGAGDIHLGRLTEQQARVAINGSGKVSIAPTDSVTVRINGAGKVWLHSNPAHVSTHIDGAGEVRRVAAER
ncbi:MAG: GIN domain-containing protein [Steroidobacteraceae bacterium]